MKCKQKMHLLPQWERKHETQDVKVTSSVRSSYYKFIYIVMFINIWNSYYPTIPSNLCSCQSLSTRYFTVTSLPSHLSSSLITALN